MTSLAHIPAGVAALFKEKLAFAKGALLEAGLQVERTGGVEIATCRAARALIQQKQQGL